MENITMQMNMTPSGNFWWLFEKKDFFWIGASTHKFIEINLNSIKFDSKFVTYKRNALTTALTH